ncbi:MAG: M20/M25/M40 family metallo-hydrolase [Myxococcales bacterium]|nr:M20/M25/M40 family metallo-hydrolase [Myxococcales bacterium]
MSSFFVPLLATLAGAQAAGPATRALPAESSGQPVATDRVLETVDWAAATAELTTRLGELLRIPSINPPGNETLAVAWLDQWLSGEGIATEVIPLSEGRSSLIARLPGSGADKPLCLLSHVDVVPAEAERWTVPPFSGEVRDGHLWGRGALDMKGMTALQAMTMVQFKRLAVPLRREVILLAVADEEVDSQGIESIVRLWERVGCSHVVNEGGYGLRGLFFEGQTFHAISVAEKGAVWIRMIASGKPGHGSTPVAGRAPEHLSRALAKLATRKDVVVWSDALMESFRRVGKEHGGLSGAILGSPFLVKLLVRGQLMANPATHAALTNTVNVTGFFGGKAPNVVPSEVGAVLDCRILPGATVEALLAELTGLVDDPKLRFEVTSQNNANGSPWDDPFFEALAARAVEGQQHAVAGPVVSVGYTDSQALRPLGVHAYGYVPFVIEPALLGTTHGDDERVPVSELAPGLRRLMGAVLDVSLATDGGRPGPRAPGRPR